MTEQFVGVLEIDTDRGVIYFHSVQDTTMLRICNLPTPIPTDVDTLLDITHMYGVSWPNKSAEIKSTTWLVQSVLEQEKLDMLGNDKLTS